MTESQPRDEASPGPLTPGHRAPLALVVALLLLAVTIVAYALTSRPAPFGRGGAPPLPDQSSRRDPAPPFRLPSLRGPERLALADFRGQVVVLNFFASWCGPCALEAADLQRTWETVRGRGVVFVGIAIQDREREAQGFLAKYGITYPAVFDADGEVMQAYRITGIPTTVIIDADGRIALRHAGIFVGEEGRARLLAAIEATRGAPR
jgi:cytochrome c biogenesis protein CcmG/thiol:disulfide interchange protein DsbE